jgi:hypothetical protein
LVGFNKTSTIPHIFFAQHKPRHIASGNVAAMFSFMESPKNKAPTYEILELIEKSLWDDVIKRIEDYPSDASLFFGSQGIRNLAIHEACKQQPPIEVLDVLIEANPNSVMTKGQWGYLPIHYA